VAERVVFERSDGTWGWQLTSDNGNIIATDGNQGYEDEDYCRMMADSIIGGDYSTAKKMISRRKK
jgi:uncharacterized protein YegP (UPF0339 family)